MAILIINTHQRAIHYVHQRFSLLVTLLPPIYRVYHKVMQFSNDGRLVKLLLSGTDSLGGGGRFNKVSNTVIPLNTLMNLGNPTFRENRFLDSIIARK